MKDYPLPLPDLKHSVISKGERWKPIPGYEGLYAVSSHGRVRSYDRECNARGGAIAVRKGRILALATKEPGGYLAVTLTSPGKREQVAVHILVLTAFKGPRPAHKPHTRHWDGDSTNNRVGNVRWGTVLENAQDKRRHGTVLQGECNTNTKITEAQARQIKTAATSLEARTLAVRFGIGASQGWAIWTGKSWKHL